MFLLLKGSFIENMAVLNARIDNFYIQKLEIKDMHSEESRIGISFDLAKHADGLIVSSAFLFHQPINPLTHPYGNLDKTLEIESVTNFILSRDLLDDFKNRTNDVSELLAEMAQITISHARAAVFEITLRNYELISGIMIKHFSTALLHEYILDNKFALTYLRETF